MADELFLKVQLALAGSLQPLVEQLRKMAAEAKNLEQVSRQSGRAIESGYAAQRVALEEALAAQQISQQEYFERLRQLDQNRTAAVLANLEVQREAVAAAVAARTITEEEAADRLAAIDQRAFTERSAAARRLLAEQQRLEREREAERRALAAQERNDAEDRVALFRRQTDQAELAYTEQLAALQRARNSGRLTEQQAAAASIQIERGRYTAIEQSLNTLRAEYLRQAEQRVISDREAAAQIMQIERQLASERLRLARAEGQDQPRPTGVRLPDLGQMFFAIQNLQAGALAVQATVETIGRLLVGQNQQLQQQQFQSAAALANTLAVTEAATGKQIEGIQKIQALRAQAAAQQQELERKSFDLVGITSQQLQGVLAVTNQQSQVTRFTLQQNTDLAVRFAAALGTYQVPLDQANQEIRSILLAQVDQNSVLAQALGITNEQLRAEKERSTLYDFLLRKTQAATDANKLQAQTINGYSANLQELFEQFLRLAGEPLTAELTEQLGELYNFVLANRDTLMDLAEGIGPGLAVAADLGGEAVERILNFVRNATDAAGSLGEGFADVSNIINNTGRGLLITLNTLQIAWNGLALIVKLAGTALQEFNAVLRNGFNFEQTRKDIAALDQELAAFAGRINEQNKRLGREAAEAALDPNFVTRRIAALYDAEKRGQEQRAALLKQQQQQFEIEAAQTAEAQLAEFKRTQAARTAALEVAEAQRNGVIAQALAARAITEQEAADRQFQADQQARQERIALLEEERRLQVAAAGDRSTEVLALDKQLADLRKAESEAVKSKLIADERELQEVQAGEISSRINLLQAQKQLLDQQLQASQQSLANRERQVQAEQALLRFRGEYFQAEQLGTQFLIEQTRERLEQSRLQNEANLLQAQMNRLQGENNILQNNARIRQLEREGGHEKEIANLRAQNGVLQQIIAGSVLLEGLAQKGADRDRDELALKQLLQAQNRQEYEQLLATYELALRKAGVPEKEIAALRRLLEERYRQEVLVTQQANATRQAYQGMVGDVAQVAAGLDRAAQAGERLARAAEGSRENPFTGDEANRVGPGAGGIFYVSRNSFDEDLAARRAAEAQAEAERAQRVAAEEARIAAELFGPLPGAATGAYVERGGAIEVHSGELIANPTSQVLQPLASAIVQAMAPQVNVAGPDNRDLLAAIREQTTVMQQQSLASNRLLYELLQGTSMTQPTSDAWLLQARLDGLG